MNGGQAAAEFLLNRREGNAQATDALKVEERSQAAPDDPQVLFANCESSLNLWSTVHTGFYPRIHDRGIPTEVWMPDYVQTYVERDVRALINAYEERGKHHPIESAPRDGTFTSADAG